VVVGLIQGNFQMVQAPSGETIVSNGVSGAHQLDAGRVTGFSGTAMRLADVETRVRSVQ
jgi:hypothetical protein